MSESIKVALVTGASRGIGKAIALELGSMGFCVVGTATTQAGAEAIASYFKEQGIAGDGVAADVSNDESVAALFARLSEDYGSPAVIVNNAGITRDNLLMRMKTEEWDSVIQTNLSSLFRVCKAGMKAMTKARWGRIINISSVVGASDMTDALPEAQAQNLLGQIPLARLGEPQEIASVVGFLASDKAAYITGETLHVNGGMYMS